MTNCSAPTSVIPRTVSGEVIRLTLADVHPPFYQLMMWLSYRVFGYTEWAGRLPSVLAGIATIPAIFLLARELFDSRTGLYAAALAAPNYYLVYYAQEARSYAFLYLLCCLSFLFFIYALRRNSWVWVFAYVGATVALVYTHYFGFILLVAEGLALLAYGLILRQHAARCAAAGRRLPLPVSCWRLRPWCHPCSAMRASSSSGFRSRRLQSS